MQAFNEEIMGSNLPITTLRMEKIYKQKIEKIADENERSANAEIVMLIKKHIKEYESKHGEIKIEE